MLTRRPIAILVPGQLFLRDLTLMPPESTRVLTALVKGTALECAADPEIAEGLHRCGVWQYLSSALFARPPLSGAAIKLLRAMMSHSQKVIDRTVELGLPAWLLQCREQSDASDDFNANVRTTLMSQDARDDLCQVLGFVANQVPLPCMWHCLGWHGLGWHGLGWTLMDGTG